MIPVVKVLIVYLFLATELNLIIKLSSPQGEDTKSAELADFPPRRALLLLDSIAICL